MLQPQCLSLKVTCPVPRQMEIDYAVHEKAIDGGPWLIVVTVDTENVKFGWQSTSCLLFAGCERDTLHVVIDAITESYE